MKIFDLIDSETVTMFSTFLAGMIVATFRKLQPFKGEVEILNKLKKINKAIEKDRIEILKLQGFASEYPIKERILALKECVNCGCNGDIKKKLEELMCVSDE